MKINLIAIGNKMPTWIREGFYEYKKRFTKNISLQLVEIPAEKRIKNFDIQRILTKEGQLLLDASMNDKIITLDVLGSAWSTPELAKQIENWQQDGRDISILIGGPEGLSVDCKKRSEQSWSLSNLTLPHTLVRVLAAESLYRAWSLTINHPYHRE